MASSIFAETLRALAPLFFLMLLGVWLRHSGALRSEHVPVLNGLVINVTLPALVIHSLATAPSVPARTLWLPVSMMAGELVTMGAAWALGRALCMPRVRCGALILSGSFGNTGFLGYPIVLALYPHQFTATILVDQIGMGMVMYVAAPLLGAMLAPPPCETPAAVDPSSADVPRYPAQPRTVANAEVPSSLPQPHRNGDTNPRAQAVKNIAAFFRSPLFIAMLLGIVIRLSPWPDAIRHDRTLINAGSVVTQCLIYLGQGTVPLIMLSMGAALRPQAARAGAGPLLTASALKLGLLPAIVWPILHYLGVHGQLLTVGVMLAAMPASVMASVLSQHNRFDADYGVGVVFVTTVLAAITLPLSVMLAR